jgi:NTP pyrophosphatase (non-canonical NTP hydrolase)
MMGEVGELCEIFQWQGCVTNITDVLKPDKVTHLGEEISDVFIYNSRLADLCGLDLAELVRDRLESKGRENESENGNDRMNISFQECISLIENRTSSECSLARHVVLHIGIAAGSIFQLVHKRPESECGGGLPTWSAEDIDALQTGVVDIACDLIALATLAGLDIGECVRDKFAKNVAKYPVHLVKGSSAKYTAYTHIIQKQESVKEKYESDKNATRNRNVEARNKSDNMTHTRHKLIAQSLAFFAIAIFLSGNK